VGGFVIEADDPRRDDVRRLLEGHRRFASSVMPPEGVHVLDPDNSIDEADLTLFSLREDGQLLGIGAIKQLGPDHAELKSMHTAADARRRGVGRALVDHLVSVAAARGVRRLSLECGAGEAFVPARSLYASAGFVPCGPFGGYTATSDNVFMTRLLGDPNGL
jgi:putative acetyltransferase